MSQASPAHTDLADALRAAFGERAQQPAVPAGDLVLHLRASDWPDAARRLRDADELHFEMLIDVSGLDLLDFGKAEWRTTAATATGYSRGVNREATASSRVLAELGPDADPAQGARPGAMNARFLAVYQLLSIRHNRRLRVRVACDGGDEPRVPSVCDVWASANWSEREAFDLFGIEFQGHPDLRRILTDYGFVGHPFRKDFPLIGNLEVRYDQQQARVVYEPVSIEPRTLVPRVIRDDNRYDPALLRTPADGGGK